MSPVLLGFDVFGLLSPWKKARQPAAAEPAVRTTPEAQAERAAWAVAVPADSEPAETERARPAAPEATATPEAMEARRALALLWAPAALPEQEEWAPRPEAAAQTPPEPAASAEQEGSGAQLEFATAKRRRFFPLQRARQPLVLASACRELP